LKYTDPTGNFGEEEVLVVAIVAIIVGITTYQATLENGGTKEQAGQNAALASFITIASFVGGEALAGVIPSIGFLGNAASGAAIGFACSTAQVAKDLWCK